MISLYQTYRTKLIPELQKSLGLENAMQVPKITKVVVNAGIGRFTKDAGFVEAVEKTLLKITGQKPVRTRAKQSISNFKIRAGQEIGVVVTLRGRRMYDFLEKLVRVTFPRVRDFRGLSPKAFDRQGNYTIGFKEHVSFPEVKMEEIDKLHGLQVVIATSAETTEDGSALLQALGFPFMKS